MILDRLLEKRASLENPSTSLSDPANWLFNAFGAHETSAKVTVSEQTATQITAFWSAVNTIADTIGELPLKLVKTLRNGTNKTVKTHPILPLLRNGPNEVMTAIVFKSTLQGHSLLWGNGYGWIKRDRTGLPREIWPLMPHETSPVLVRDQLYFDAHLDVGKTRFPARDVLHVPALSRNGIEGMSIIREQREALGSIIAANQFGSRFFGNGAKPGGMISYPGKVRDPNAVRDAIMKASGGDNVHGTLVLSDDAKYTPIGMPPEDAQFLQTREFGVDEIARMFRLPSHFLNKMGQATFNNLEQMGTHFAQYTMMPWIIRWEQELTRKLLTEDEVQKGFRFKFNVAALVRGDIKTRSEVYAKAVTNGWMTRNEVRALEDMNPIDGLDEPLMPANLLVVGDEDESTSPVGATDVPGDESDDNEPNADESEEQDNERGFVMLTAMVQRLANKEANALRRIAKKHYDAEQFTDEVAAFYRGHIELMAENLAIDPDFARQYCERRAVEFAESENRDDVILRWTTEGVSQLVNRLSEDL